MGEQNCYYGEMYSFSLLGMDPQYISIYFIHKII